MTGFLYSGNKTNQISFPLGGLGTGCIGLAGNGRLIDWEIYNRPNKGSVNGFSHFAIKAERDGKVLDARVLHGDLHPPYSGEMLPGQSSGFGKGPRREYLTGLPHFLEVQFRGEFPLAEITFLDKKFPAQVSLSAFNPFIPLNERDSGIPAAFFEINVQNTTSQTLTYTIVGVLGNPLPAENQHTLDVIDGLHILQLKSNKFDAQDTGYGDLTFATDAGEASWQRYWFRGPWFDSLEVYWRDFITPGKFKDRVYELTMAGSNNHGMLAAHFHLEPGQSHPMRFVISWNFPNCENYWQNKSVERAAQKGISPVWKNYYATQWEDSSASAVYALKNWDLLSAQTHLFKETLFASDLPEAALDAVSANLSILKSPTVMRLEDGTFYGWEGCHASAGCCEGSCTHVWNYAQALPFLFPSLERSMREADYRFNLLPDGGMPFRLQLPLGVEPWNFRPCADGQFGGVLKAYRDWKISGDTGWLRGLWQAIKRSIEYAWSEGNEDRWDPTRLGVLTGRQHHTLDMELFGPNAWLTGFYLGALKAGAEMADAVGEPETAAEYRTIFERGKAWVDDKLFNGEYYYQKLDLADRSILEAFETGSSSLFGKALAAYWDEEHQEIKYQLGEGCGVDQVLAQWHASLYGLGEIFDPQQVNTAVQSVLCYNFKKPMRDSYNPCRIYCLNDEGGLVIAAWPEGKPKPVIPMPYTQETMNGFEYAHAAHMIQLGYLQQGMAIVEAVRERYDGERRNPWNEFECGSNYARSLASYALLNAFSGFQFDMVKGKIGFLPPHMNDGTMRCFWSLDSGWGEVRILKGEAFLCVLSGELRLNTLELPFDQAGSIYLDDQLVLFHQVGKQLHFIDTLHLMSGQVLRVVQVDQE